jgi:cytochrome c oxidase assembly protein subunit 11
MPNKSSAPLIVSIGCIVVAALGTAFSATLLRGFSNAAGFEGHMTARRPIGPIAGDSGAPITVRLDTNVLPGLAWHFQAEGLVFRAQIGVPTVAFLRVENHGLTSVSGHAILSVTPDPASYHFMKADDFANRDVTLAPGESQRIPIAFYFDKSTVSDPEMAGIRSATVSYAFSPAKAAANSVPLRSLVAKIAQDVSVNAAVTYSADPRE